MKQDARMWEDMGTYWAWLGADDDFQIPPSSKYITIRENERGEPKVRLVVDMYRDGTVIKTYLDN